MACVVAVAAAGMIKREGDYLLHMECERPRKRPKLSSASGWDVQEKAEAPPFRGSGITSSSSSARAREGERAPSDHHHDFTAKGRGKGGITASSPPWRADDKDGHYTFALGDNLTPRYKILSKMGEGTFGQVLECWDRQTKQFVAVKIVRGLQKYREAAMIEIDVLFKVAKHDRSGTRCVQMLNWFDYRNHVCIVFEKLGPSLYDFLRKNSYRPFPIDIVRELGRQLLESVACVCTILVLKDFLSHNECRASFAWWMFSVFGLWKLFAASALFALNMHDLRLVHTDLKPENVLLVSSDYAKVLDKMRGLMDVRRVPKSSAIKVIDFGSTTFEHQDHSAVVSTRHYRAPEVILGLGWSYPCDIWSVGCILVELCTGATLFQTHENLEHLAMMERVLGPLPVHMIKKADWHFSKYFRHRRRLDWPEGASSRESIRAVRKLLRLPDLVMQHVDESAFLLIDLLQGLLKFEPLERLKAREALRHPFFTALNEI